MKIVKQTPETLVVRTLLRRLDLIAILAVVIGLPWLVLLVGILRAEAVELSCDRLLKGEISCQIARRRALPFLNSRHQFRGLQGARIREGYTRDGKYTRVYLIAANGREFFLANNNQFEAAIKDFIITLEQKQLNLSTSGSFEKIYADLPLFLGINLLFAGALLGFAGSLQLEAVQLDKKTQQVIYSVGTLWRSREQTYAFDRVERVEVEAEEDTETEDSYRAFIFLRSGDPIPLTPPGTEREDAYTRARHVRKFLGMKS